MMLGNGTHRRIVASTLAEIRGALPLAKEGILDEVLTPTRRAILCTMYIASDKHSASTASRSTPVRYRSSPSSAKPSKSCL